MAADHISGLASILCAQIDLGEACGDPCHVCTRQAVAAIQFMENSQPKGYRHLTPVSVEAIRSTCMTHADRVGKTQDEVFRSTASPEIVVK